jgi:Lipocalin-like domain
MAVISSVNSLVGTWKLLSREDVTAHGQRRIDPILGGNPLAYLMYDGAGHFAVQFMKRDRGTVEAQAGAPMSDSGNSSAWLGYDAYFGRYTVEEAGTVTQELIGALSPRDVGKVVTRRFQINGSDLVIELETMASDGEPVTRTLRWQRVG